MSAQDGWRAFQRRHGLVPDGDPGPQTLAVVLRLEREADDTRPLNRPRYSYGGPRIRPDVDRDPMHLLRPFADQLERLFRAMRDAGHDPMAWELYRSEERADELAARRTGASGRVSMHCLGAAADIVDRTKLWDASPEFWRTLGQHAERLFLTWGGTWKRADKPHVQAVAVHEQDAFRAMGEVQRAAYLASRFG